MDTAVGRMLRQVAKAAGRRSLSICVTYDKTSATQGITRFCRAGA